MEAKALEHIRLLPNRTRAHGLLTWQLHFKSRANFIWSSSPSKPILQILSLTLSFLSLFAVYSPTTLFLWQLKEALKLSLTLVFAMKGGKSKANTSKKADSKLAVKKAVEKKTKKAGTKGKGGKDPNKPKRPPSAFFVFMEQFRKEYKEKNPKNKLVSVVGKAGGDKWKSLSDSEKAPYVAKAEKLKAEYQKKLKAYDADEDTKKESGDEEASEKSKSEVSDEDDGSDEGDEEDDE
ncbi:hypothetical protein HPP92_008380 [Vanilla planifolia]|nr:hypothetical protein HPP92_008380 [Vanilla planifolia]